LRIAYERKAHRDKLIAVNVRGISGTQSMNATIMTVARYAAIKAVTGDFQAQELSFGGAPGLHSGP
jgi:hypothetical protein